MDLEEKLPALGPPDLVCVCFRKGNMRTGVNSLYSCITAKPEITTQ